MIDKLPDEAIGPTTVKEVVLTIVAVLVLVIIVNIGWALVVPPSNKGGGTVIDKWEVLNELEKPVDWLVLGDSSGGAVVTTVWDDLLGGTSVNLSTIGTVLVVNDAWMLETYIDRFGPPPNVLMVHAYDIWYRNIHASSLGPVAKRVTWRGFYPSLTSLSSSETARVLMARFIGQYLPLYFEDLTAPNLIRTPWRYKDFLDTRPRERTEGARRGARRGAAPASKSEPDRILNDLSTHLGFVRANQLQPDPVLSDANARALDSIGALAEEYEFDVYLAYSPLYDALYQDEPFQEYLSRVRSAVEERIAKSSRVHILAEPLVLPIDQMSNSVEHVTAEGSHAYTEWLVTKLQSLRRK